MRTTTAWRKSTYSSGDPQSNCVEVAWRKSSYSGQPTQNCVEVALTSQIISVRDSKNTSGPVLAFPASTWRTFTRTGQMASWR